MPNSTDLSTEALLKHRAIAEKATPGPWESREEGQKAIDDEYDVWSVVYGTERVAIVEDGPHMAANRAHIAANSPDVVKAHVDEILRLRDEVERLNKEAYWLALHLSNAIMFPAVLDQLQASSAPEGRIPTAKMLREQIRRDIAEKESARKAVEKNA